MEGKEFHSLKYYTGREFYFTKSCLFYMKSYPTNLYIWQSFQKIMFPGIW